jgi:hypothetical protein
MVNWVYLHLTINHAPVILAGLGFLAALAALVSRKRIVWIYALTTLTLSGLSVYPVFLTGSQAEDIVVDHDRNARKAVHQHEEAADWALWTILATGALSAYALYGMRKDAQTLPPVWLRTLVFIAGIFAFSSVVKTSLDGGKIRHEEWERSLTAPPDSLPKS